MSRITGQILSLLNPVRLWKAYRYKRNSPAYDRSRDDLELGFYASVLQNDMLHYGYFEDPETRPEDISISELERAQVNYARKLIELAGPEAGPVLDAGCGMGGLTAMLKETGTEVTALTPNIKQVSYIRKKYPDVEVLQSKYEEIDTDKKYKTIIHSESLQYINLSAAFSKTKSLMLPGGRWIISDYFRITDETKSTSGHKLEEFRDAVHTNGWEITYKEDITSHILPTLRFIMMYWDRVLSPARHLGIEKLRIKNPFLYSLTGDLRESIDDKIRKELASVSPDQFAVGKCYMIFVLEQEG